MRPDSIRAALERARLYLCTDARIERGDLKQFLDAALAGGVDIVQLRHKGPAGRGTSGRGHDAGRLEADEELRYLEVVAEAAQRHGKLWAVNDRADIAAACGAPVLHLGQDDLPVRVARSILGAGPVIGRSTHSPAQFDAAAVEPGVDYLCAGPTWATPTKPGRPAAGPALLRHAASQAPGSPARPWFAIGGIDLARLDEVIALGARRVVVVRAITEAADPGQAARTIADRLRADMAGAETSL